MSKPQFYSLTVADIRRETPECVSIAFHVPEDARANFHYKAGQYLTLRTWIDDQEVRRSYSICACPSEQELRVAVKQVEQGKFSSFANQQLKVGDVVEVMPPLGKFSPREDNASATKKRYLAFVAGSGITPVISIMKSVLKSDADAEFTLVYGNKNRGSIIFKEELEALKNKYMERLRVYHVFTREKMDTPLFNGRITAQKAKDFCDKLIDIKQISELFVCGPEEMILDLRDYFISDLNFESRNLHFELFSSPDQPRTQSAEWKAKQESIDPDKMSLVTIKIDGASFEIPLAYAGENILDAALQHGADLPFACKGGVCCTCKAKLVSGEVDMELNYALEPDEVAANFILTCQAHPRSEKVVVDFDTK